MSRDFGLDRRESSSQREDDGRNRGLDHETHRSSSSRYQSDRRDDRDREFRHQSHRSHRHHSSRSERSYRDREREEEYRRPSASRHDERRETRLEKEDELVHPSRRGFVEQSREDRPARIQDSDRNGEGRYRESDRRRNADLDVYERTGNKEETRRHRSRGNIDTRSRRRSASPHGNLPPMRYEQINEDMKGTYGSGWGRSSRSPSGAGSPTPEKEMPNYEQSGALMGDKLYKGVSLQYVQPPESRKPDKSYRFYVFKDGDISDTLTLDQQATYLFGRDRTVADVPLDHPSCSKQHAVLQYRLVVEESSLLGEPEDRIAPFIYDLGSANGTHLNGKKVPAREYVELKEKDMVTFGLSSREYLLLTDEASQNL